MNRTNLDTKALIAQYRADRGAPQQIAHLTKAAREADIAAMLRYMLRYAATQKVGA